MCPVEISTSKTKLAVVRVVRYNRDENTVDVRIVERFNHNVYRRYIWPYLRYYPHCFEDYSEEIKNVPVEMTTDVGCHGLDKRERAWSMFIPSLYTCDGRDFYQPYFAYMAYEIEESSGRVIPKGIISIINMPKYTSEYRRETMSLYGYNRFTSRLFPTYKVYLLIHLSNRITDTETEHYYYYWNLDENKLAGQRGEELVNGHLYHIHPMEIVIDDPYPPSNSYSEELTDGIYSVKDTTEVENSDPAVYYRVESTKEILDGNGDTIFTASGSETRQCLDVPQSNCYASGSFHCYNYSYDFGFGRSLTFDCGWCNGQKVYGNLRGSTTGYALCSSVALGYCVWSSIIEQAETTECPDTSVARYCRNPFYMPIVFFTKKPGGSFERNAKLETFVADLLQNPELLPSTLLPPPGWLSCYFKKQVDLHLIASPYGLRGNVFPGEIPHNGMI